jgi:hypothetical protein
MKVTKVYPNGNNVAFGENGDHVKVRAILATGLVPRVSNFGPLRPDRMAEEAKVITSGDFELHIVHRDEVGGFDFANGFTTSKDVNDVYYQRISK